MAKAMSDGLARLQSQSRISSNTWRKWCNLLELDPLDAVEVWEEICHPIMLATNKMPEIPYILQMRATRIEMDIFDFKEEVPQVLQAITFLYSLKDERLSKGKLRSAILKFYKRTALALPADYPPGQFAQKFIFDLGVVMLLAKVLKGPSITMTGVLKPVIEGRGSLDHLIKLGLKSMGDIDYADVVRNFLEFDSEVAVAAAKDDEDDEDVDGGEDVEEDGEDAEDEYGDDEEEDDDDEDEDEDEDEDDEDEDEDEDDLDIRTDIRQCCGSKWVCLRVPQR